MNIKITLLPGDGIGPEIMESAVRLVNLVADRYNINVSFVNKLIGGASIDKFGIPLTDDTIDSCASADAVLLGAVGGIKWEELEHNIKPEAGLLKLRKSLALYANIRPAKVYPAFLDASSLRADVLRGTDFIVLRELTGGIYFGEPRGYDDKKGWNTMVYLQDEVDRIVRMAFITAKERQKKVISVDKANVLECSQFWRSRVQEIHKEFPDIELQNMYVDNAAMQIVRDGMLPSASLGDKYALYEPVHGSAPDIAGKNMANPIAMLTSVAMMFNHTFQMTQAAKIIEDAVELTLEQGYRTNDIHSDGMTLVSTTDMSEVILKNVEEIFNNQAIGVFTL